MYWVDEITGKIKRDIYGHPIVYHDLFATVDYDCDHGKLNDPIQQTPDGIAEAFIEFAKKEKLSFFP